MIKLLSLALVSIFLITSTSQAQTGIDKDADQILSEMGDYLGKAGAFSFRAHVSYDEFAHWGQEIQYGGTAKLTVQRPNRLNVSYSGDNRRSRVVFDGEELVFHDLRTNLYATLKVPGEIDNAIDQLFEQSGHSVPVADLLYSDPYETLLGATDYGLIVGQHTADGVTSHHLAFSGEVLDWQIWIEAGAKPLPRQLVITYKEQPGAPQYRVRLTDWDFQPDLPDDFFKFTPPENANTMEFLWLQNRPVQEGAEP